MTVDLDIVVGASLIALVTAAALSTVVWIAGSAIKDWRARR